MIDHTVVKHHIQKHILSILMHQANARFRDMRPTGVDTNLYSYHLKLLLKTNLVEKTDVGYRLTIAGMAYVDRLNIKTVHPTPQPKLITMLIIQNGYGGVLMYQRKRQPFIDRWTVPLGKVHDDDESVEASAQREIKEKIGDAKLELNHAGEAYIRVRHENRVVMSTLVHVFYAATDEEFAGDHLQWIPPHKIDTIGTAPAVDQIIARTFFRDPYFFEEFTVER